VRIAVVGVGALGCLLGACLSVVADVILLGHWPEQIAAIQKDGLRVENLQGQHRTYKIAITSNPESIAASDVVLVAVKSRQTGEVARMLSEQLDDPVLVLTLQNGLNNRATLVQALGPERVALGVTSEGATILAPGIVRHAGRGNTYLGLDRTLGPEPQNRLKDLERVFIQAGFTTQTVDDANRLVWGKLAVNAAINPLTTLLQVPNGFLIEHQPLKEIMGRAAEEVALVARAKGIELPFSNPAEQAYQIAEATAANISSMLQDFRRGVPTEIDVISGAVDRLGQEAGIPTPINSRLYQLVHEFETGDTPPLKPGDVAGLLQLLPVDL
jgi:2-dehydropantoate 2-reductase